MPITDKQFLQGLEKDRGKIIDFLESNSGNAYLYEELASELGLPLKGLRKIYYGFMLNSMALDGLIEVKPLNMHSYYRAVRQD